MDKERSNIISEPKAEPKKKPLFSQNAGIFLICVALSSVFWLLINLGNKFESKVQVPVNYVNFPADRVLTKELPTQFDLLVTAPGWDLLSSGIRKNERELTIDLSNYELSNFINTSSFSTEISGQLPSEFQLLQISPLVVQVQMEAKVNRKLPVRPVLDLSFEPQYDVSGPIITEPDSVIVSGAGSYVNDLKEWRTKPISARKVAEDLNLSIAAEAVTNVSMTLSDTQIKCYVPVDQFTEKTFENIPIELVNCEQRAEVMIYPNNVNVTFQISLSDFDKVSASQFQVAFNCAEIDLLNTRKADLKLTAQPEFIKGISIHPATVDFIIYR